MRRPHAILGLVVAFVAALAFAHFNPPAPISLPASPSVSAPDAPAAQEDWTAPVWTGGEKNARQHWEKHGAEFPEYADMQAYVEGVHAFLLQPPQGVLVKHRENGDTLYFDPARGIFAVQASDGAPRTFFKPDNGLAYWKRQ